VSFYVTVGEAGECDREAIREVMGRAAEELRAVYRPTPEAVERARSDPQVRWLVAEMENQVIGALRYKVEGNEARLGLGVDPRWQGRGVGRALIGALAEKARVWGVEKLTLATVIQAGKVPAFERLGFRVVEATPARWAESIGGAPLTEAIMERGLTGDDV
jgi:GNAT superfamily N-acetyltransferase